VKAIVAGEAATKTAAIKKLIEAGKDDRFAFTGGGLHKLGNNFYLSLGNNFQGQYRVFDPGTPKDAVKFTQKYTEQIRVFTLKPNSLDILAYGPLTSGDDPSRPLYRRDGVIKADIDPKSGTPRIAAFGGVFKPGTTAGYTNPIYIYDNNSQPTSSNRSQKRMAPRCNDPCFIRCPVSLSRPLMTVPAGAKGPTAITCWTIFVRMRFRRTQASVSIKLIPHEKRDPPIREPPNVRDMHRQAAAHLRSARRRRERRE
jgi:hypothetical protein